MNFEDNILQEAKKDFQYLLDRGFPRTGALTFVSNHYLLNEEQRNYLNQVFFQAENRIKEEKLIYYQM